MRLIDADEQLNWLDTEIDPEEWSVSQFNADWIYCFIDGAPTVDAVKVVRGEWEFLGNDYARCTHCGRIFGILSNPPLFKSNNKFCRRCGAKMDGERR